MHRRGAHRTCRPRVGRGAVGPAGPGEDAARRVAASSCRCKSEVEKSDVDHRRGHRREGGQGRRRRCSTPRSRCVGDEQFTPFDAHGAAAVASTRTGASTWPRSTTCARASTCAAMRRRTRSRNTSARPSSCSRSCSTSVKIEVTRVLMTVRIQSQEQVGAGRRGDGRAAPSTSATSPTRTPNEDGSVSTRKPDAATRGLGRRGRRPARRPQRSLPLRQRQEVQALPRQARPETQRGRTPCPSICPPPIPADAAPGAGRRASASPMAGMRKANRKDLTWCSTRRRRAVGRRVHAEPLLRRAGAGVPRAPGGRVAASARCVINTGNANAGTGEDGLARARATCVALAQQLGRRARAGAAVFHRRDHGDAAGRSHRGRPAGRAGRRCAPTHWARRGRGHHDHRHAAQGGVAAGRRSAARPSPSPASARAPA